MNRYEDSLSFRENKDLLPQIKRVATVHDISCLGRCALTVIIPVLSAMGVQAVPLPTALLSTHTGGFENMFFEDLTRHMSSIADHWKSIGTDFDAIYSGFLGSEAQIDMLTEFLGSFSHKKSGEKTFIAVDPVMGDDGKLYSTYSPALAENMRRLCYGADLITPNLTEASILCKTEYPSHTLTEDEAHQISLFLMAELEREFGREKTVLTGIGFSSEGKEFVITCGKEKGTGENFFHRVPKMERSYPGTGDVFSSVLLGSILSGRVFKESVAFASDFVCHAIEFSQKFATPIRDGLVIEPFLSRLINDPHF